MNEKEFNKKLKESMETPRDISFDESAWATLETALDKEQKEKKRIFGWWLIPLFLLVGVVGWNINLQQRVSSMKQEINTLESALTKAEAIVSSPSTSEHNNIVYLRDTIYQYLPSSSPSHDLSSVSNNSITSKNTISKSLNTSNSNNTIKPLFNSTYTLTSPKNTESKSTPTPLVESITPKHNLDLLAPFALTPLMYEDSIAVLDTANYAYATDYSDELKERFSLKPIKIQVGATSGGFYQSNLTNSSLRGNLQGIAAKVNFGKNIRLLAGAEWVKTQYESNDRAVLANYKNDIQFQGNASVYAFGLDTAFLVGISNNERGLQIPLGLEFAFLKKKKFRPTVHGGIIFIKPFSEPSSVDLEYSARNVVGTNSTTSITQEEFNYTIRTQQNIETALPVFVGIGLEYHINKNWLIGFNSRATFRGNILSNGTTMMNGLDAAIPNLSYFNQLLFNNNNTQTTLGINGTLLYTF